MINARTLAVIQTRLPCRAAYVIVLTALFTSTASAETSNSDKTQLSATVATSSITDQSGSCAQRYHAMLGQQVLAHARATQTVADDLRSKKSDLPGYWLFWDGSGVMARSARQRRLLATQLINESENTMCVRSILARGGRIRCLKWKPIPPGYVPPPPVVPTVDPAKPEISEAERRIAASVSRRVIGQGGFSEFRHGTALYHMAQRATDELIIYASQPHRETICSGAPAMVGFYQRRLEPLKRKAAAAKHLRTEARTAAVATTKVALATTSAQSLTKLDTTARLRRLLATVLSKEEQTSLATLKQPMKILQQARTYLSDERFNAMPKELRGSLRKALRNSEFAEYAVINDQGLSRLKGAYETTLDAITRAHATACTCTQ